MAIRRVNNENCTGTIGFITSDIHYNKSRIIKAIQDNRGKADFIVFGGTFYRDSNVFPGYMMKIENSHTAIGYIIIGICDFLLRLIK